MSKILVVEDEREIRELVVEFLKEEGHETDFAEDGLIGYEKFKENDYDLLIIDWMMPKLDGYSLCNLIRNESDVPIIFLTALDGEEDQIKAFDAKIDDYISKPFSFKILIKRVEAVLRRREKDNSKLKNTFLDLELNEETYKVFQNSVELELTLKEFNILKMLIRSYPRVVSREMLMDEVWGYEYYGDMRVIDAHIKNIRKKISKDYIKTVKGIGYVLKEDA
ncbi:response regulator transcription factor [Clostridium sp. LY3-2]|uniref:response regulator transcription factor n=1 Tax=Clostridium sp. LY3-2 TaxID=2942482 RepID=UPI002153186A|nr:response regulator transcription factor [Clostridium sp. LY3-2]MCR6515691.1 response regulator transcription factor [Clostridium sp. LY3-2]